MDAYIVRIAVRNDLREGSSLCEAVQSIDGPFEALDDQYPDWHPAPYSFQGMVRLFLYREISGESYRKLGRYPELTDIFGLRRIPGESVLSRAWRHRFNEDIREFITTAAHYVVKEIHDEDLSVPAARPKEEVLTPEKDRISTSTEEQTEPIGGFSDETIHRTTRLAREHGFGGFDSGRTENATYEDTQFFELQTFMGMVGCGTAQGASRFQMRRGEEYGPHGDTHLRTLKQFAPVEMIAGFDEACDSVLSVIASEALFRRPVTVAIDITNVPYYGDVEGMPMVSGLPPEDRAFKFATLSFVGRNIPLVLAVEPVRESSAEDENPSNKVHRVVRRLVRRAKKTRPDRDGAV